MASVTPPKRYALRSDCTAADNNPRISTHAPNTSIWGPNCVATIAPTIAPSAVPTNRCPDTLSAAPSDDCAITRVVIAAQYSSGNRNSRAASTEATAATAVRTECVRTSHHVHWTFLPAITFHLCWDAPKAGNTWSQRQFRCAAFHTPIMFLPASFFSHPSPRRFLGCLRRGSWVGELDSAVSSDS